MFTAYFWKLAIERALKSAAQFALVSGIAGATDLLSVSGMAVLGAAGAGFVVSLLTSVATGVATGEGTPSAVPPAHEGGEVK